MKKFNLLFIHALLIAVIFGCGGGGGSSDSASDTAEITSFIFSASKNEDLDYDIEGQISGTAITAVVPYGVYLDKLTASFETGASSVTVNGTAQTSGSSANDFSSPLVYTCTKGEETVLYTVTVTEDPGFTVNSYSPENGATGMSPISSIEIELSAAVKSSTLVEEVSLTLTASDGTEIYGRTINDTENKKLVFVPFLFLEENTEYTFFISGDIRNQNLIKLGSDTSFSFTTGDFPFNSAGDIRVFCNYEMGYVRKDLTLTFSTEESGAVIQTGWTRDLDATEPDSWTEGTILPLTDITSYGSVKIFSRAVKEGSQVGDSTSFIYKLVDEFPTVKEDGHAECYDAYDDIFQDDSITCDITFGPGVSDTWQETSLPNGFVMGNGGVYIYTMDKAITDGKGYDFAVGENTFRSDSTGEIWAELFYVEVSSDGENFLRFDSASLTDGPVGDYGYLDPANVYGLGSLHLAYYGYNYRQPYDLAWLKNKEEVVNGTVDLANIKYVKYIDIPGTDEVDTVDFDEDGDDIVDGTYTFYPCYDSFGNVIIDAYLTWGSGGADVYRPGVIHLVE